MKKLFITGLVIFSFACTYDNAEDLYGIKECPPEGVSFSDEVEPIINTNCAIPGCHTSGGQQPTLETYEQVSSNAERIKTRTSNGTMPPPVSGIILSQKEIDDITCWVDAGALDN